MTGHLSTRRGKRVLVLLRDGSKFIKKFRKREDKYIYFDDGSRVRTNKVRTLSLVKGAADGGN